jgi:Tol biopolymer transport system component
MHLIAALIALAAAAGPPVAKAPGLVVSQSNRIYVEGRQVSKGTQPRWSPDGKRIAFVRDGSIYVARADGTGERRLTRSGGRWFPANSPAWSPDGSRVAFGGPQDIFTVTVAGARVSRLTQSPKPWLGNFTPAYSPDGKRIAFARSTDAFNSDIFLMRTNGTGLVRLTKSQGTDSTLGEEHGPAWSPDGRSLVYVSNRDRSFELYRIDVSGRNERRLTHTPSSAYDEDAPRFSRDGKRILYAHDGRIAVLNVDGTRVRELGLGASADWRS